MYRSQIKVSDGSWVYCGRGRLFFTVDSAILFCEKWIGCFGSNEYRVVAVHKDSIMGVVFNSKFDVQYKIDCRKEGF